MAAPIEPIGADSEITIQARQQQQQVQQSYTVMQQRQQQQLQQQRRQEQIRKLQVEAAARRQRAEKDRLMGWGADVKGAIDAPKTPMLAERITGMRPRDGSAPRGESLAENMAAEEERRSVEFMSGEARRAVEEEHSIAQARATRAYHMSLQAMEAEMQRRHAAFEEYKKYSEDYAEAFRRTDVTYSDYLKAFKAGETTQGYDEWKQPYIQQELFRVQYPDIAGQMAELSNISQHMAQEGWGEAYAKYGDVTPRITKLQQAIQQEKGLSPEQVQTLNVWLSDVSAQNVAANRQFAAEKSARATLRKIQDAEAWQPKTLYEQAWFRSLDPGEQQLVAMSELPLLPVGASETFRTAYGEEGEAFVGRYTQQVIKGKEIRAAKTAPPDLSNLPTGQTFSLAPFYRQNGSPDPAYVQRFDKQLWDLLSPVTSAIKSTHESYERYIPAGSAAPIASTIVDLFEHTPGEMFRKTSVTMGSQIGQKVLGIAGIDTSQQRGIDISKSRKAILTEIVERPVPAIAGGAVAGFTGAAHEIVKIPHYLTHPIETAQAIPGEVPRLLEMVRSGIETSPIETGVAFYAGGKVFRGVGQSIKSVSPIGAGYVRIPTGIEATPQITRVIGVYGRNPLERPLLGKTEWVANRPLTGIVIGSGRVRPFVGSPVRAFGETPIRSGYLPMSESSWAFMRPVMLERLARTKSESFLTGAIEARKIASIRELGQMPAVEPWGTISPSTIPPKTWGKVTAYVRQHRRDIVPYGSTTERAILGEHGRYTLGDLDLDIRPKKAAKVAQDIHDILKEDMPDLGPLVHETSKLTEGAGRYTARMLDGQIVLDLHPHWEPRWNLPTDRLSGLISSGGVRMMPIGRTLWGKTMFFLNYRETIPGKAAVIQHYPGRFKDPADITLIARTMGAKVTEPLLFDIGGMRTEARAALARRAANVGDIFEKYTRQHAPEGIPLIREGINPIWRHRAGPIQVRDPLFNLNLGFQVRIVPLPRGVGAPQKPTPGIFVPRQTRSTAPSRDPARGRTYGRSPTVRYPAGYPVFFAGPPRYPSNYRTTHPAPYIGTRPIRSMQPYITVRTPRRSTYPAAPRPSYPSGIFPGRPSGYPPISSPGYPQIGSPGYPPVYPPSRPPTTPPPPPPLIRSLTPTRRGRRPWRYDRYRRREVIAPIATPWEVLGIRPPERVVRESARVAASRPQLIFVADQRRQPVADRHEARALEKLLSGKQRKKTLFW